MNWRGIGVWGFAATLILTTILTAGQAAGLTRMDLPFMLGSMVTPNRDRARVVGFVMHFINGWLFAIIYAIYFGALRTATWWLGMGMGLAHGVFVLVTVIPFLPGYHPRMVSDFAGPAPTRQLEPPGFLALNYGSRTPVATVVAHIIYGAILGTFYRPRQ